MKFELSKKQVKQFKKWSKDLPKKGSDSFGTRFMFSFVSSGIGDSVTVKDLSSGQLLDLTDYENF